MIEKIIKTNKQIVAYSIGDLAMNNFLKITKNKATAKQCRPVVASLNLKNKSAVSGILSTEAPFSFFISKLLRKIKKSLKTFIYLYSGKGGRSQKWLKNF